MKVVWSKNKTFIAVVLALCTGIWVMGLHGSHMELTVKYSQNVTYDALYVNPDGDGYIREDMSGENVSCFKMDNFEMKFEAVELCFQDTAPKLTDLYISSRNHVLFHAGADNISNLYTEENSKIIFSKVFLKRLNRCSQNDWFLKLELIAFLLGVLTVSELFFWVKNRGFVQRGVQKVCGVIKRYRIWLLFVTVSGISAVFLFVHNIEMSVELDKVMEIPGDVPLNAVTKEEISSQEFISPYAVTALQIRFATYGEKLEGSYELRVYDAESGTRIATVQVRGKDIKDNNYTSFQFEEPLRKNTVYRAAVVSLDAQAQSEVLAIWASESDVYQEGSMVLNGEKAEGDWCFKIERKQYGSSLFSIPIWLSVLSCVFLVLFAKDNFFGKYGKLAMLYGLLLLVFLLEMTYQRGTHSRLSRYDENAQLSFLAYIAKTHEVIPVYEEAMLIVPYAAKPQEAPAVISATNREGEYRVRFSETVNYLGHPPLYYWLMDAAGGCRMESDGLVLSMSRLRTANMMLVLVSVGIFFYIGASRIDRKRPGLHLLYGSLIAFMPLLVFEGVTVNNDNLNVLAVAFFALGALRFTEQKRNYATYVLIALGICTAMLTKVTAGIVLLVAAVVFLVWSIVRDKSLKVIGNRQFAVTLPLYLLVFVYFIFIFRRYGTFQPRLSDYAPEQFLVYPAIRKPAGTWKLITLAEYFEHFISGFMNQWGGVAKNRISAWVYKVLWFFPVLTWVRTKKWNDKKMLNAGLGAGLYITVLLQMLTGINRYFYSNGRVARQSRYFACMIGVMAFIFVMFLEELPLKQKVMTFYVGKRKYTVDAQRGLECLVCLLVPMVAWGAFVGKLVSP